MTVSWQERVRLRHIETERKEYSLKEEYLILLVFRISKSSHPTEQDLELRNG